MTQIRREDWSNGYEAIAREFMAHRTESTIGVTTVREWAEDLSPGATVLDLGSGHGVPISHTLIDAGLTVYAVEASPSLAAEFRIRFPEERVNCEAVEESDFFDRSFDGVVAWGLLFLLPPQAQKNLIHRVAQVLKPGGRFLFTAPNKECEWKDNMTGQPSASLGADAYRRILDAAGLTLAGETEDEGENHYFFAFRPEL
jgi:2-polyprenyl-3-methyl-5-hydroxy-6-metoxy-1,4-benzoquinol methylase